MGTVTRIDGAFFIQRTWTASDVRSLCWRDDELIDWVAGGEAHGLDGSRRRAGVCYAYRFDAAIAAPDGRTAVIYERLGTKGLLLREGASWPVMRELNRSFYQADAYEYPVCLFVAPNGRLLLAHCPEEYNRIEIEDVVTGERLTAAPTRKPSDFFHSRLQVNHSGSRLLSAGWVWHPWDAVVYFDLGEVLQNPTALDRIHSAPSGLDVDLGEETSACWQTDTRVLLGGSDEVEDPEDARQQREQPLAPRGLAVCDLKENRYVSSIRLSQPPGTMMPVGPNHVLALYEHPKLISLDTGKIVHQWNEIASGTQTSSILRGLKEPIPPIALDPSRHRIAIASDSAITVLEFTPAALSSR